MTPTRSLAFAVLAAALASGCTVYDDRQLTIAIVGSPIVATELRVQVDASPGFSEATLSIDGRGVGTYPVGREVVLDVSALDETDHTVEARVEAGHPPQPARATFTVDRGPPTVVSIDPQPGPQPPGSFHVDVRFSRAIDPTRLYQAHFVRADGSDANTDAALLPDGRTVRLSAYSFQYVAQYWNGSQWVYGTVTASLTVWDLLRRRSDVQIGPWTLAAMTVTFDSPASYTYANAIVTIALGASGYPSGGPEVARVYANEVLVAELGPPPWNPIAWDTRLVAEGRYLLQIDVPGWLVDVGPRPYVTVDRTPRR